MMDIKEHQQVWSVSFFDKKTGSAAIATSKARVSVNELLVEELHKPVIEKFKRRKGCVIFKDSICAEDLAEMESLSSKNKNVKYLLCQMFPLNMYGLNL